MQTTNSKFEIIDYINNPMSFEELKDLLDKLELPAIDLVRKNEAIWKESYKGKDLSEDQIIQAMADFPKLIERPIVVSGNKAVIGRPPEKIKSLF